MKHAVSVLEVSEPATWAELAAAVALDDHLGETLTPTRRVAQPSFEREVVPQLTARGVRVLLRRARRDVDAADAVTLPEHLPESARSLLFALQRHAVDGTAIVGHAADPHRAADDLRRLLGASAVSTVPETEGPQRIRLHPALPPPPAIPYTFADAVMPETDDLTAPRPGPLGLLHDLAALAAAIERENPHRTHAGTLARADAKRLGALLGFAGALEDDPRWGMALRGLEALRGIAVDPITRAIDLDHGLDATLAGDAATAIDRLIHRLVEPDLHPAIPAVRAALHDANTEAIDEVVFLELLRDQHRDVLFPPWGAGKQRSYPQLGDDDAPAYTDGAFLEVEAPMLAALIARLTRIGVVRRAEGVFAATTDGRAWARCADVGPEAPPIWVSSDLELVVPPGALTPGERFQIERVARCLSRDVVDRYKLDRPSLERWLSTHDVDEAIALLHRRASAVPTTVVDALRTWAASALRVVLTRGVVIER